MQARDGTQSFLARSLAILTLLFARPPAAQAGNDDALPVGIDAAQAGAAVTATSTGGAAAYYNPAGLATSVAPTIDANLNAYGIRLYDVPRIMEDSQGRSGGTRVVDTVIVPTLFAHVARLSSRWVASVGIYVPKAQSYSLSARLKTAGGADWRITQDVRSDVRYFVLGLGTRLFEHLRIGGSLLAVADSNSSLLSLSGQNATTSEPGLSLLSNQTSAEYGGSLRLGVQWDVSDSIVLGLTLVAKTLVVVHQQRDLTVLSLPDSTGMTASGTYSDTSRLRFGSDFAGSPGVRIGGAWLHAHGAILADATLNVASDSPSVEQDRKFSWNVRAGTLYTLSPVWRLGAGIFSDRNPLKASGIDDYGVTLGGSHTTKYELRDGRTIAFMTGVGLRYAFGFGRAQGIRVPTTASAIGELEETNVRATNHELSLNLGTGISL